jgi:hypothetical protein
VWHIREEEITYLRSQLAHDHASVYAKLEEFEEVKRVEKTQHPQQ